MPRKSRLAHMGRPFNLRQLDAPKPEDLKTPKPPKAVEPKDPNPLASPVRSSLRSLQWQRQIMETVNTKMRTGGAGWWKSWPLCRDPWHPSE